MMCMATLSTAAAPERLPEPVHKPCRLVESFDYSSNDKARSEWKAKWAAQPVRTAAAGKRNVVAFPCRFKTPNIKRSVWDKTVNLDLADSRGLQFKILCPNSAPISAFTLYLKSGAGWYSASFSAVSSTNWRNVVIHKSDTRLEGNPAGWSNIEAIRISAWKGAGTDTVFYLANLGLLNSDNKIVLIRSDSVARNDPEKSDAVRTYSGNVAQFMEAAGIPFSFMSDLDLTSSHLKNKKLAILPYNPGLSKQALDTLHSFLARDGKLICFYNLSGSLQKTAGINLTKHRRRRYKGEFSSIRASSDKIKGLPPVVFQQSWNILKARAIPGKSSIAALWFDHREHNTGEPALLVSDNCIFMTHVLLNDDPKGKTKLMLALTGHFIPGIWKQAAENMAEKLDLPDTLPETSNPAIPNTYLQKARRLKKQTYSLLQNSEFIKALDTAEKARDAGLKAYASAHNPQPGEHRAFWCHRPYGVEDMSWEESIRILSKNGFTTIMPNMCWGGVAYYKSKVLPMAPEVSAKGDRIKEILAACRQHNIKCHIWKVNFKMGSRTPDKFLSRMVREKRVQKNINGKPMREWLCPSHPENFRLEVNAMVEIAENYPVDGLHLDYIRYPDSNCCFCQGCRKRFESFTGQKIARWPEEVQSGGLKKKWLQFRRNNITRVVMQVSRRAREIRPDIKISAAVFSNWPVTRDSIGQDWQLWCQRGYLDFVCPMNYTESTEKFAQLVQQQRVWSNKASLYPGIGLSTWKKPFDIHSLIEKIKVTRKYGTGGFTIFQLNQTSFKEIVPLCGLGITAPH